MMKYMFSKNADVSKSAAFCGLGDGLIWFNSRFYLPKKVQGSWHVCPVALIQESDQFPQPQCAGEV
jgi:hypothetical protein